MNLRVTRGGRRGRSNGGAAPSGLSNVDGMHARAWFRPGFARTFYLESLILAQNERWRHGLGMQVERSDPRKGVNQWRKGEERVRNLPSGSG